MGGEAGGSGELRLTPIGIIHTPYSSRDKTPVQRCFDPENEGEVEVFEEYERGLDDVEGFSHIILIYHFHLSRGYRLKVRPFLDEHPRGVFATRAPWRPNPIGLSIVRLEGREGRILRVRGVDMVDGTPLLDIKPHVPPFGCEHEATRIGWLEGKAGVESREPDDTVYYGKELDFGDPTP